MNKVKVLSAVRCAVDGLRSGGEQWKVTPSMLLLSLGIDRLNMEVILDGANHGDKTMCEIKRLLECYSTHWRTQLELMLIQQYSHPWLKDYDRKRPFNFAIIHHLLDSSKSMFVLSAPVTALVTKAKTDAEIPRLNLSGINDDDF